MDPARVKGGAWGARFQGDIRTLPPDLDGLTISVTASSGDSWDATITQVVERSPTAPSSAPRDSINEHRGP